MSKDAPAIVHIIDDDESLRTALGRLLGAAGLRTRTYSGAGDFLLNWHDDGAGCILLDVEMPGGPSGPELHQALNRRADALPVVFLTGHGDIGMGVHAMKFGAVDFLTKPVERDALFGAVEEAIARDRARRDAQARDRDLQADYDSLSPREREVFKQIIAGRLNKQIAYDLGTSERTIKAHRAHVMEKFHVHRFLDLIKIANRLHLE
ncbi:MULTISPECIES: response regulator transcription factor [unclassified Marinobacter]|uniref:response regulator transcription factor n=1 Tax=unclassified Marinobacter TaxID=83889 RepID=UPI001925C7DC|nr:MULTISPECIES: response regulator [unclassified Marinobacter]MBL3827138.1 response regulator transcription factor [Marinobacter sp. MC3]MBL3895637.1 response regulator transcription factor [Marinobacter sp. MW3]